MRLASTIVPGLALAFTLTACGGSTATEPVAAVTEPPAVAGGPSDAQLAGFAAAFSREFPDLAEGRSSKSIGDDADNTCLDLSQGADRATVVKHVQARFAGDQAVSAKTAGRILALVKTEACGA